MQVAEGKVVAMSYTLTDPAGQVIDQSPEGQPLAYLHGAGNIIPGLEQELAGLDEGQSKVVTVQPEDGYGPVREEMIQPVPRERFPEGMELEIGQKLQAQDPEGGVHTVVVTQIGEDAVVVDANHPLAGVVLKFEVEIQGVRDATPEEIEHGHPHGPGGHVH